MDPKQFEGHIIKCCGINHAPVWSFHCGLCGKRLVFIPDLLVEITALRRVLEAAKTFRETTRFGIFNAEELEACKALHNAIVAYEEGK